MEDCIFCKIVKGEIPCYKVYEDSYTLAFLDIGPINPGHTLVIPKKHYKNIQETPEDLFCKVMAAAKKVAKATMQALGYSGYNFGVSNGPEAGQVVMHLHAHIMPRRKGDGHKLFTQGKYKDNEEMKKTAERISSALKQA